jgi:hypothetical protein
MRAPKPAWSIAPFGICASIRPFRLSAVAGLGLVAADAVVGAEGVVVDAAAPVVVLRQQPMPRLLNHPRAAEPLDLPVS